VCEAKPRTVTRCRWFITEVILCGLRWREVKNSSLSFDYQVYKDAKLLSTGKTTHVFCNKKGKPLRIPHKIKEIIDKT